MESAADDAGDDWWNGTLPDAVAGDDRIRVEVLMQSIERLVVALRRYLGPGVGVAEGFNATDGD